VRKIVYICSRLRGDVPVNIRNAQKLCRTAVKMGHIPFAPHLLFTQFLDDAVEAEREVGISAALQFIDMCDELWVDDSNGISEGMRREIKLADDLKVDIRYGVKPDDSPDADETINRLITAFKPRS
jgi:hypothetical protein